MQQEPSKLALGVLTSRTHSSQLKRKFTKLKRTNFARLGYALYNYGSRGYCLRVCPSAIAPNVPRGVTLRRVAVVELVEDGVANQQVRGDQIHEVERDEFHEEAHDELDAAAAVARGDGRDGEDGRERQTADERESGAVDGVVRETEAREFDAAVPDLVGLDLEGLAARGVALENEGLREDARERRDQHEAVRRARPQSRAQPRREQRVHRRPPQLRVRLLACSTRESHTFFSSIFYRLFPPFFFYFFFLFIFPFFNFLINRRRLRTFGVECRGHDAFVVEVGEHVVDLD